MTRPESELAKFLSNFITGFLIFALLYWVMGSPDWAAVGFGTLTYLLMRTGDRVIFALTYRLGGTFPRRRR